MERDDDKLVLVHQMRDYDRGGLLGRLTRGVEVAKPSTVGGWRGAVLAHWPTEEVLGALSEGLAHRATAACIMACPWTGLKAQAASPTTRKPCGQRAVVS